MPDQIFNQDVPDFQPLIPFGNLIPIQGGITTPTSDDIEILTSLLAVDYRTDERFAHFYEGQYDLSDNSHLVRFLKALLGDTGAGQLRKRSLVVRLQNTLSGSRFFDLDRFYGAIFGAARKIPEVLPLDPMESTATPDEWDEITAADAQYRNRVTMLGRSIAMGGTVPGLTAAAEALTGVDCDLYETWPLIDNYGVGGGSTGRTWDDTEADFPTWGDIDGTTWAEVEDIVLFGRTGTNSRSEFVVRVKKEYDTWLEQAEDELAIVQVLGKLKPASVLMTVDPDGLPLHQAARISGVTSDSDYWEVVPKVSPRTSLGDRWAVIYPHSLVRASKGLDPEKSPRILPRPPLSGTQGRQWDHNSFVSSVLGYTIAEDGTVGTADNFDRVPTDEGTVKSFSPAAGLSDSRSLAAARATGDGITVSHPYTGARQVAKTAT
jgi:hypothetical protein